MFPFPLFLFQPDSTVSLMLKEEGYRLMGAAFEVYNCLGYLINFGHRGELQWNRFILSDLHQPEGEAAER